MRASKFVIIPFILLFLIVVLALTALLFVNPAVFRGQLEAGAEAALGRQVKFDGPIRLERSLRPRIIIEDINIGNPDWAKGAHFGRIDKISVQVALFALLGGELRVLDVSFTGLQVFIEKGPEGANNYTFRDRGQGEEAGVLPAIDKLLLQDLTIYYQADDDSLNQYQIAEARLWNIPGEPERIEGKGAIKGMPFTFLLAADSAAELSGPQNPWSLNLYLQGPDMSLTLAGRMIQPFKWDNSEYHIKIDGKQADSLESLFDIEFPTTGPFEISGALKIEENSFRLTDLAARIRGPSDTPEILINNGAASSGPDQTLRIALQGKYGDDPFTFAFASMLPSDDRPQANPWPIEAGLDIADTTLNIKGTLIPGIGTEHIELDAKLQGETLDTLARIFDTELPKAGPYRLSFHTQVAEGSYSMTDLEGTLEGFEPWKTIQIVRGEASVLENGTVKTSIEALLNAVPLSLSFQGGPGASGDADERIWPFNLEGSAAGATLKGDGAVVTAENQKIWQMATGITGKRFESIGTLFSTSLPALGKYDISADLSSDGDVHTADNLKVQVGASRLTGRVRWEDRAPQPFLKGKLSLNRLELDKLLSPASKPSSKTGDAGLLDHPIRLDSLKDFDAKLELALNRVANSPIPLVDVSSAVTLSKGKLSAPFRATVGGAPVDGRIQVSPRKNTADVSLKAKIGKLDVGQTLNQLDLPDVINGTADAIQLDGSSTGKTLRALGEQASFGLQVKPANLNYTANLVNQKIDFLIESAKLKADKTRPLTASLSGMMREVPFKATVSAGNLADMIRAKGMFPVQATLQTADLQLKVEGTVHKPLQDKVFDLTHEISGKEIEGLDPLFDFVMPLRGAFRAQGRLKTRGNRFTYEEHLQVGKSDLKVNLTVLQGTTRPKITGKVIAGLIHLDDIKLFDVDQDDAPSKDKSRVIPEYTVPIDVFLKMDLDLDIQVERLDAGLGKLGEFGNLTSKVNLQEGRFQSSTIGSGSTGAVLSSNFEMNAAVNPPMIKIRLDAKDLDYGLLFKHMGTTDRIEGRINLYVNLSGHGATRRIFLGNADGRITIIGKSGIISTRMMDLWAADLVTTMLSPRWQRQAVTEMNCIVTHLELKEGVAEIDDILLDTQRITIAGSGILDLETEEVDLLIAPRPKRASLVSLANPVRISGTLSQPKVSVTKLPRGRRLAGAGFGIFAGLVNPAFLIFAFIDTGTGKANPCDAAVERAYNAIETRSQ